MVLAPINCRQDRRDKTMSFRHVQKKTSSGWERKKRNHVNAKNYLVENWCVALKLDETQLRKHFTKTSNDRKKKNALILLNNSKGCKSSPGGEIRSHLELKKTATNQQEECGTTSPNNK
ncbi:hypothetical protein CEXT_612691 [Caerostris extrusa]|uniref:Uncharacterized protein n=1 Tax=Caerostris extrusa TaxID=172846 RepID=A0AAV4PVH1_CAEEX|nr:hypothetical protein CEXT_612691 [Caerostris extrusa]